MVHNLSVQEVLAQLEDNTKQQGFSCPGSDGPEYDSTGFNGPDFGGLDFAGSQV